MFIKPLIQNCSLRHDPVNREASSATTAGSALCRTIPFQSKSRRHVTVDTRGHDDPNDPSSRKKPKLMQHRYGRMQIPTPGPRHVIYIPNARHFDAYPVTVHDLTPRPVEPTVPAETRGEGPCLPKMLRIS